jgi:parallel beta-helix repeat protein
MVSSEPSVIYVPDDYSTIQAAINAAEEGDIIIVRPDIYYESIDIDKTLTLIGEDKSTTIINSLGAYEAVEIRAHDVFFSNFTIMNASNGIKLYRGNRVTISECVVYNYTYDGIGCSGSSMVSIINCTVNGGVDGFCLEGLCGAKILNCKSWNNSDDGFELYESDGVLMVNCSSYNNTYGYFVSDSSTASMCGSESIENDAYGAYITNSEKFYASRCQFHNNSDGFYLWQANGVIVNTNITLNRDDGIDTDESYFVLRYCFLDENADHEIELTGGIFDARWCWWGNSSGPAVVSGPSVQVDPWQTELNQPEPLLSDLRCRVLRNQVNRTVYVPTGNIYDDSTFYAFYAVKEAPQQASAPQALTG